MSEKLFCDLKTDEEKSSFFLSGRGYETGVIAASIQNDVAMAYHRCAEYKKELEASGQPAQHVESIHLQDLKNALAEAEGLRKQLALMDEHSRGEVWRWQADGTDNLASMGNRMGVLIYACDLRALLAQPATYKDSTPDLRVGDSSFEAWFSGYNPAGNGDKQRARDAYAAGMGDPLVTHTRTAVSAESCPICFEGEPHTGTCGSDDPKALCNRDAPVAAQPEPLHITHGPLMRHAAALLRLRQPVPPDFEQVAAELERAIDGHPTPSGEPSPEWLHLAAVAAQPSVPDGFRLIAVNSAFDDLMYWLDRCENKGHLENCADLIEPWQAFEYRELPTPPAADQAEQAVTFVHELAMGTYKPDEIEARAKAIAKLAPLDAQQDAEKVDAQPLTRQNIFDRFSFLEGLVTEHTYRRVAETAISIYEQAKPPDPAMAGDEWLDRLCKLVLAYKDSIFIDTEDFLATRKTAYEAVINHARKRVQPASGEDAKPARAKVSSAPSPLNMNDKAFWVMGWNDCLDSIQQERQP